jgi:hypothetical protein
MIERASTGAGCSVQNAVEDRPAAFISVETPVDEVAEEAGALGIAVCDDPPRIARTGVERAGLIPPPEMSNEIANGRLTETHNFRRIAPENDGDEGRLRKRLGKQDCARISDEGTVLVLAREAPFGARDDPSGIIETLMHSQNRCRIDRIGGARRDFQERSSV